MPAPQQTMLSDLTKTFFMSKMIALPLDWSDPGEQFPDAFAVEQLVVAPNGPANLFRECTLNFYHVEAANQIGTQFENYIEGICGAICSGIDKWMKMAMVSTMIVNGPVGMLLPGGVTGPPLMPLIFGSAPKATPMELMYSRAIANALSMNWQTWQSGLMGTLMYPAFAAFPGPVAPPTPNVPLPLITLTSAGESMLSPAMLKNTMSANHGDPTAQHADDLFDALANAFNIVFLTFKSTTMLQNVLGMGPVPSFVPPFVPVGPVVMGSAIPTPGVFV